MSELASSIAERKRLVIRNPDGSFLYCNKAGERDTACMKKIDNTEIESDRNNFNMFPDNFTISDEELQYIIENHDQYDNNTLLEQIILVFRRNRTFFCFLFILEMSLCSLLLMLSWKRKEYSIQIMQNLYKDINNSQACILFYGIFFFNLALNILFYPLGFYSLMTKKIQFMKFFSTFCMYSAFASIFIVYLNVLILYGYSRLVLNLLVSLLMLHRAINTNDTRNNNNIVINDYNTV